MEVRDSERRVLGEGRFARLVAKNGWEWVERTNVSGAVVIVAVTGANELVLVEQHRIPLGCTVVEPPAGLAGDSRETHGEELITAARRELLEETGFEADQWEFLTEGPSSAGLADEVYSMFLAHGARRVARGGGEGSERITVHVVPLQEVESFLDARRATGAAVDPKVYAGLYFVCRRHSNWL
ncbi:MAG: NUDIX hydrolase [Planctomycetota bacterium]